VTATDGPAQDRRPGTVLVTGGASGLGAAVALAVETAGGRPFVLDLVTPRFAVDHELVDLADGRAAAAAVDRAAQRLGARGRVDLALRPVAALGLEVHNRIVRLDRVPEQRIRVSRRRGHHHMQAGAVHPEGFR